MKDELENNTVAWLKFTSEQKKKGQNNEGWGGSGRRVSGAIVGEIEGEEGKDRWSEGRQRKTGMKRGE